MATARFEIYRCEHCGNIVEVIKGGGAPLFCCGEEMALLQEQTADSSTEKHVPVIEKVNGGVVVKVGSVPHPMLDAHSIQWIEVLTGGEIHRSFLSPGGASEAFFPVGADKLVAREYCNLHGLWKS